MIPIIAYKRLGRLNHIQHNVNYKVSNLCSMTPLDKKTVAGLRKNQNLKTDPSPDLNPVEILKIVSIVVQVINVDSDLLMGKL